MSHHASVEEIEDFQEKKTRKMSAFSRVKNNFGYTRTVRPSKVVHTLLQDVIGAVATVV